MRALMNFMICLYYTFFSSKIGKIEYKIARVSIKSMLTMCPEELKTQQTLALANIGGAYVVRVDQSAIDMQIELMKKHKNKIIKFFAVSSSKLAKPGYTVVLIEDAVKCLTRKELKGIIAHELGHLVNGDLVNAVGIIVNEQQEIAADAYAAGIVGAECFISALTKIIKQMEENSIRLIGKSGKVHISNRIEALQLLM